MATIDAIDVPASLIAPAKLNHQASPETCGLFFPYRSRPSLGLSVDWEGECHLIRLDGDNIFGESGIDIGINVRGVVVSEFDFRVDLTSRYNSLEKSDPIGALTMKDGELFLTCFQLGDPFHDDPYPVRLRKGCRLGQAEEACGFTRWSIAVQDDGKSKIVRSFQALTAK